MMNTIRILVIIIAVLLSILTFGIIKHNNNVNDQELYIVIEKMKKTDKLWEKMNIAYSYVNLSNKASEIDKLLPREHLDDNECILAIYAYRKGDDRFRDIVELVSKRTDGIGNEARASFLFRKKVSVPKTLTAS